MRTLTLASLSLGSILLATASPAYAICGDGVLEAGEACDDGNTVSDDGCGYACYAEAGYTCPTPDTACDEICACWLLVADDFDDNLPDLATWDYLTGFNPGAAVVDSNSALTLTNGAWVATERTLDPIAEGGLRIRATWHVGAGDEVSILTRSNLSVGSDGFPQIAGARFTASEPDDTVTLEVPGEAPQTVSLAIAPGDELWFDIRDVDLTTELFLTNWPAGGMAPGSGPAPSILLSNLTPTAALTSNYVVFANRPAGAATSYSSTLDDVQISSLNIFACQEITCPTEPAICESDIYALDTVCDDLNPATGSDVCDGLGACAGVLLTCDDGILDEGEECDDGGDNSDSEPDACRTNCTAAGCGDNVIDTGEECDDGIANSDTVPNSCRTNCRDPACGDGALDDGEACDDGNVRSFDGCSNTCSTVEDGWYCDQTPCYTICGDDTQAGLEQCDDGGLNSDTVVDACRADCRLAHCGDNVIDTDELCDYGLGNSDSLADTCRLTCVLPVCGDRVVDSDEVCDDGAQIAGDGCAADCSSWEEGWECSAEGCVPICGDGVAVGEEECDDGDLNGNLQDGCRVDCTAARCGDGIMDTDEACDDGNSENNDACLNGCVAPTCGDNYLYDFLEECDDGDLNNDTTADACRIDCTQAGCGDGVLVSDEACDDGNRASHDGCSSYCSVEEAGSSTGGSDDGTGSDDDNDNEGGGGCAATPGLGGSAGRAVPAGLLALLLIAGARRRRRVRR